MAIAFKSYCWVLGTTSFRTSELNKKIELQLQCLNEFWAKPEFANQSWHKNKALHKECYKFLKEKGFLVGTAQRPDKDAREKTSGLVEFGLLDEERRITLAGKKVLEIANAADFSPDHSNLLELPKDSYQYFLQLLKAVVTTDSGTVRPFVTFLNVMNQIKPDSDGKVYLTSDEFTYLLPLCMDVSTTEVVVEAINKARTEGHPVSVDPVILTVLMNMANYQEALSTLKSADEVDEDLICVVGINRKSSGEGEKKYDAPYYNVYETLHNLVFIGVTEKRLKEFVEAIERCAQGSAWKRYFFNIQPGHRISSPYTPLLRKGLNVFRVKTEGGFRTSFFCILHLLKVKATLRDYADLNRRYFGLSDIVIFQDEKVQLDALPRALMAGLDVWLKDESFKLSSDRDKDIPLESIVNASLPTKEELVMKATGKNATVVSQAGGVQAVLKNERYARFRKMLDTKFPKSQVMALLEKLEDRKNDKLVQAEVTDNADVPTIFEYLVGLAWYYVSGLKGDVLEYMNLSLGPDFLPKVHAGGGEADIVWSYAADLPHYKAHVLLLEVTMADRDAQRRMEMEPVSRHMGDYRIAHPADDVSYCTFVAPYLNPNVIADYRGKKAQYYYNPKDSNEKVYGLKIIPIDTKMLRQILDKGSDYRAVYKMFDTFYQKEEEPIVWHNGLRAAIAN